MGQISISVHGALCWEAQAKDIRYEDRDALLGSRKQATTMRALQTLHNSKFAAGACLLLGKGWRFHEGPDSSSSKHAGNTPDRVKIKLSTGTVISLLWNQYAACEMCVLSDFHKLGGVMRLQSPGLSTVLLTSKLKPSIERAVSGKPAAWVYIAASMSGSAKHASPRHWQQCAFNQACWLHHIHRAAGEQHHMSGQCSMQRL